MTATRFLVTRLQDNWLEGRLLSGELKPGMELVVLPAAVNATLEQVEPTTQQDHLRILLSIHNRIAPGDIVASANDRPEVADQFAADLSWVGDEPLFPGRDYQLLAAGGTSLASVSKLKYRLGDDGRELAANTLRKGEQGRCNLALRDSLIFDTAASGLPTAEFILQDTESRIIQASGVIEHSLRRASNVHWQALAVDKQSRAAIKGQAPRIVWLTGLSASGKSTIANLVEQKLLHKGRHAYLLDGDNIRHGLNKDLGFTDADRVENIRRVAETAKLMVDAGLIVITSFISPFRAERETARSLFQTGEFVEVFVDTALEVCEQRDPKGLYRKARQGQIKNFTGFDSPYEAPENPEIHIRTADISAADAADLIISHIGC